MFSIEPYPHSRVKICYVTVSVYTSQQVVPLYEHSMPFFFFFFLATSAVKEFWVACLDCPYNVFQKMLHQCPRVEPRTRAWLTAARSSIFVCFPMNNEWGFVVPMHVCARVHFSVRAYACVCVLVDGGLTDTQDCVPVCVLMGDYECWFMCVSSVCVCFLWAGADYRLKAHVRVCCYSSVKDPLSTDSTPPRLFHLKFHRCIRAAQWQHVSTPALNFPAVRELLAKLQIGVLGLSLHSSWTSLSWFESLLKTFFFLLCHREKRGTFI